MVLKRSNIMRSHIMPFTIHIFLLTWINTSLLKHVKISNEQANATTNSPSEGAYIYKTERFHQNNFTRQIPCVTYMLIFVPNYQFLHWVWLWWIPIRLVIISKGRNIFLLYTTDRSLRKNEIGQRQYARASIVGLAKCKQIDCRNMMNTDKLSLGTL